MSSIRRHRTLLIVLPLAGLLLGVAISAAVPQRYEAELTVRVGLNGVLPLQNTAPIESAAALAERIRSAPFQQRLADRLARRLSSGPLPFGDRLRARALPGTMLVVLTGSSADLEVARSIVVQAAAEAREQHQREVEPNRQVYRGMLETRRREMRTIEDQIALIGGPAELGPEAAKMARADSLFVSNLIAQNRKRLAEVAAEAEVIAALVELPSTHPTVPLGEPVVSADPTSRPGWLAPLAGLLAGLLLAASIAVARTQRA